MRWLIVSLIALTVVACETPHEQFLEFQGFTVDRGVYRPKPGGRFIPQGDGTFVVALADGSSGGPIEPCDCALETGGSCDQATAEDENGNIIEIWCVDSGCGFCVGGTTADPDDPLSLTRFRVECLDERQRISSAE